MEVKFQTLFVTNIMIILYIRKGNLLFGLNTLKREGRDRL